MRSELFAVHGGAITFAMFATATDKHWMRLARTILRRWRAPIAVDEEDVKQELLVAAWKALDGWDASKADLERYIVFTAMSCAKRWVHKQRGVNLHDRPDHARSAPVFVSDDDEMVDSVVHAAQEDIVFAIQRLRFALRVTNSEQQRVALRAVMRTGSVDGAANELRGYMTRRKVQEALHRVAAQMG